MNNELMENNSADMKTEVETFLIEETAALIYDNDKLDAWNKAVGELGLEGQRKIQAPDKSPVPFLHMKKSLINIFETLCPVKVDIKSYNLTPIPVEILNLVLLSTKEHYFGKIEIWYDDAKPDPVCVGEVGYWYEMDWYQDSNKELKGKQFNTKEAGELAGANHLTWNTRARYLIGRWADVKHSFDELKQIAHKRYTESKRVQCLKHIKAYQRELDDIELEATERFN